MGSSCVGVGAGVVRPGEYEAGEVRKAGKKRAGTGSSKMVGCRSEMQNATRCQITHHQLSAPASNSNTSDLEVTPGARFSKAPKLFGRISGDIILFVQWNPAITKCHGTEKNVRYSGVFVIAKTPL